MSRQLSEGRGLDVGVGMEWFEAIGGDASRSCLKVMSGGDALRGSIRLQVAWRGRQLSRWCRSALIRCGHGFILEAG